MVLPNFRYFVFCRLHITNKILFNLPFQFDNTPNKSIYICHVIRCPPSDFEEPPHLSIPLFRSEQALMPRAIYYLFNNQIFNLMVKTDLLKCRGGKRMFVSLLMTLGLIISFSANNTVYGQLACNDQVQVSLDANCQAEITPQIILEGEDDDLDPLNYTVTVNGITANSVTITETGTFPVIVSELSTGNSCWGNIVVEDKLPPVLDCACPEGGTAMSEIAGSFLDGTSPTTETCGFLAGLGATANFQSHTFVIEELTTFTVSALTHSIDCNTVVGLYSGFTPNDPCTNLISSFTSVDAFPMSFDNVAPGTYQMVVFTDMIACDYNIVFMEQLQFVDDACLFNCTDLDGILNGTIAVPMPTIVNTECMDQTITFNDFEEPSDCASSRIIRTYSVTDGSGNVSTCTFEFLLGNIGIADVTPPTDEVNLPCDTGTTPQEIFDFLTDVAGLSDAEALMAAYPTIDGVALKETTCGLGVTSEDQIVPICPGEFKILRTWTIVDWCTGDIETLIQIIKFEGPDLVANIETDGAIGFTNHHDCLGHIILPSPNTNADVFCSEFRYSVGFIAATDNGQPPVDGVYLPLPGSAPVGETLAVYDLPLGKNWIRYTIEDECGRRGFAFTEIFIHDLVPPNPVCDEFTVVSLTSLGWAKAFAETFDDGSFDNCSDELRFFVRRTDDNAPCINDPHVEIPPVAYEFQDKDYFEYVPFCCSDVGNPVSVELIVVDNASERNLQFAPDPDDPEGSICIDGATDDNVNFCWVQVDVQDKSIPVITCPEDITLHCTDDVNDFEKTGFATLMGICANEMPEHDDDDLRDDCGYGVIFREFYSAEHPNIRCVQRIDIPNPNNSIVTFPADRTVDCTDIPGPQSPEFSGDPCAMFGYSVKSDTFLVQDGACFKILNNYTVIDWCVYDPTLPLDPIHDGVWTGTQVIEVFDNEAPVVDCQDETFGVYAEDCQETITLTAIGTDVGDCPSALLSWKILVDIYGDGQDIDEYSSFASPSSGFFVEPTLPGEEVRVTLIRPIESSMHNHIVHWTVTDGCGNEGFCESNFMVVDAKPPTPYCLNLSTALMEHNGEVRIWACDFDLGSFDNCTAQEDLAFTFRGDINRPEEDLQFDEATNCSYRIFDCSDLPATPGEPFPIEVYVWDEKNNRDFCVVMLTLVDNNNVCGTATDDDTDDTDDEDDEDDEDGEDDGDDEGDDDGEDNQNALISGTIATAEGLEVRDVEVFNQSLVSQVEAYDMTNESGEFAFENNPMFLNYSVRASKDTDYLNGVSTLDLVIIQKHILGLELLENGYKVVAADINNDERVTAVDLIELRKLILGIYTDLPDNQSWRFISSDQTINQTAPWPLLETNAIQGLEGDRLEEDFIAVKVGDVNANAAASANQVIVDNRSNEQLELIVEQRPNGVAVVAGNNFTNISGYQFTMSVTGAINDLSFDRLALSEANFGVYDNGIMTTSFADAQLVSLNEGDVLFTVHGATDIRLVDGVTKPEAYQDTAVMGLSLRSKDAVLTNVLSQNNPNPFSENTNVSFTIAKAGQVSLTVYDLKGQIVKQYNGSYEAGTHSIQMTRDDLQTSGVLYYTIESGNFTSTKKMILLK